MKTANPTAIGLPTRPTEHESFLAYARFRYLRLAALVVLASVVLYVVDRPYGTRYGGSWAGYTLGTAGALLIFWLTWFGYRKRTYAETQGRVLDRLSAHVYLGLALIVVATLHTGFHFGWNVHTLAYALMCVVILSGMVGVYSYLRYPRAMTENRAGMTIQQMLGMIATLDEQLRSAALPLDEATARRVQRAIERNAIGGSPWRQLTGQYRYCTTAAAIAHFDTVANVPPSLIEAWSQVRVLLEEKASLLARVRRDIRYKALMDFWLYIHVPLTFMLLAALVAHILSVFYLF